MTHEEQLRERVVDYLDSQNWKYTIEDDESYTIRLGMNLESKLRSCQIVIIVAETDIQVFTISPINATKEVYSDVVEFITRANYGIKLGNFEFDYSDGEVRYHCCLVCNNSVPSLAEVERCVDIGFIVLNSYGDGLAKNLMGFGTPEEDIAEVE